MTFALYGLLYLSCVLLTLGIMVVIGWWLRYAVLVGYLLLPGMMVLWGIWGFFVAIPMGLLFDGSAAEQRIVRISHWLNDQCLAVLWFALTLPFKALKLAVDLASWLLG
ncbi:hypothetical protein GJ697_14180 [Pseudoduganella sp. FT25W]|jgi:hypothetical protein|uniref:Uncharacterized protein n=1 Tax=Duganella alba TaxID=2666081 RepID=A0A6L5QGY1_9BURK|nr:hypothetical protein [Duganella alba]MRX08986.1 hypothetical protein [Duganella alba]MRX18968.1 hypothetical protein [Duganella alba]